MDFSTKMETGYYHTILSKKGVSPESVKCNCGRLFDSKMLKNFCEDCGFAVRGKFNDAVDCAKELDRQHFDEIESKQTEFANDCIESVGLKGHPKAGDAFSVAWELSGSSERRAIKTLSNLVLITKKLLV